MLIMHHSQEEGSDWSSLQKDTLTPSTRIRQGQMRCFIVSIICHKYIKFTTYGKL